MAASLATSVVAGAGDAAGAAGLLSVVVARDTPTHQHSSAHVSIRQHTSAYGSIPAECGGGERHTRTSTFVSIRQHSSAFVIRQNTSAYLLSVVVARDTPADLACLTVADSCNFFFAFFIVMSVPAGSGAST